MEPYSRRGHGYFRLYGFLLCLSLAVFLWGLQGKLALYHAATPSSPRIVAKLIQDGQVNKRASAKRASKADSSRDTDRTHNAEQRGLSVFRPKLAMWRNRQAGRKVLASIPAAHRRQFFRPPPIFS